MSTTGGIEISCLIDQISVFVENRPGKLAAIAEVMEAQMINFLAFSIAEADGFGLLRAVVSDPKSAVEVMRDLGYAVITNKVIGVKMRDQPGGLKNIANTMGEAGINVEYGYAFTKKDTAVFILRVDDPEKSVEVLKKAGVNLIDEEDLKA